MQLDIDNTSSIVLREIYDATKHDNSVMISYNQLYRSCAMYSDLSYADKFPQILKKLLGYKLIVQLGNQTPNFRISSEGREYIKKKC